jgi:ferredoxin
MSGQSASMRSQAGSVLHIDWTRCDARGSCTELLPELLRADPWGYPLAAGGGSDVAIPARLEAAARDAVGLCPVLALRLVGPSG